MQVQQSDEQTCGPYWWSCLQKEQLFVECRLRLRIGVMSTFRISTDASAALPLVTRKRFR